MNKNIETIIFDYGGTLDTNGIHWSNQFWEAYKKFDIQISKEKFREAYVYSEQNITEIIQSNFSLLKTYKTQIKYQLNYLLSKKILTKIDTQIKEELSKYCYKSVIDNLSTTTSILNKLNQNYKLGLISNYYGNVETVLTELNLAEYFIVIIDSSIFGIRKPEKEIFEFMIKKLNANISKTIMVGDSYKNDIKPAKKLGMNTIWLKNAIWNNQKDDKSADIIIDDINYLKDAIDKIELRSYN